MQSDEFRAMLARHFRNWDVNENADGQMLVVGWLRGQSVGFRFHGERTHVMNLVEALVKTLMVSERMPG